MTKVNGAPLIRRGRRNANFTAVSNKLIDHPKLSPDARIALVYLLSKPDDWVPQIEDLRRVLGTGGKPCGRNKTYEVLKELKASAYVVAVATNDAKLGRFGTITYYVFDEPHDDPNGFARSVGGRLPVFKSGESLSKNSHNTKDLSPNPEIRETVARPNPGKPHPEKEDDNKDRREQKTEIPPPPPIDALSTECSKEGRFDELWSGWPEAERPKVRAYAERVFDEMKPEERRHAVRLAASFRARCKGVGKPSLMIPFLKGRFRELVEAPTIDHEGYFVITPSRPEWSAWMAHYRARHSARICADTEQRGVMLRRSRWPEDRL